MRTDKVYPTVSIQNIKIRAYYLPSYCLAGVVRLLQQALTGSLFQGYVC